LQRSSITSREFDRRLRDFPGSTGNAQRRIAIEVDGMAYHVGAERFCRDRSRPEDLVGLGWTVLRFTWADLAQRPATSLR
jgi:very-short-patch-repair endonuclease